MPLDWIVSHEERLVTLKSSGALGYYEMESALAAISAKGALAYRKLLDARAGRTAFEDHEVILYTDRLDGYARRERFGPYAIVVGEDGGAAHDPLLQILLPIRGRPIRVFADVSEARDWLLAHPVPIGVDR